MKEILPAAVVGVTDRLKDTEDYVLNDQEKEKLLAFYEGYGFKDLEVHRIEPNIGPKRDEVWAAMPYGWTTEWRGYWGDYIDINGVKQFSVFRKGAPWDYCFFARR